MPPLFFRFLHHYSIEELSPSAPLCMMPCANSLFFTKSKTY